jgi:hypothetical protein
MKKLTFITAITTLLFLSGCKVVINTDSNGYVITESGAYNCAQNSSCNIDVVDIYFDEVFVAVPNDGYRFKEWRKRSGNFCGGDNESCALSTAEFGPYKALMAILETNERFYLEPAFELIESSQPSTNLVKHIVKQTGGPYVADATGKKIGTLNKESRGVITVNVNFEGIPKTYVLTIRVSQNIVASNTVSYSKNNCDESGEIFVQNNEDVFIGANKNYFIADPLSFGGSNGSISIFDSVSEYYNGYGCELYDTGWLTYPALKTDLKISLPVRLSY